MRSFKLRGLGWSSLSASWDGAPGMRPAFSAVSWFSASRSLISGSSSRRYTFATGTSRGGGGTYAFRLGGGATNGFLMKPPELRPPGLKGAIGGAADLLNAAIRSLNELLVGFSETGGGGPLGFAW